MQVQASSEYVASEPEYELMAENDDLALYVNQANAQFYVLNKADGSIYYSNPNHEDESLNTNAENALFELTYIDSSNNSGTMNAYADSVQKGQFSVTATDDGVKYQFTVGIAEPKYYCPYGISQERFEAILEKIDSSYDKAQFKAQYSLDSDDEVYYLKNDSIALKTKAVIDRILKETGYDDDDYEIDLENGEGTANTGVCFNLYLYVKLDGDKVVVDIPLSEVSEFNGAEIKQLSLLENFAAPTQDDTDAYFLLPDGSGTIMNAYNGKGDEQDYEISIYGSDESNPSEEQIYKEEQAYLPIFAICYSDKAVFAEITDGDSIANVFGRTGSDTKFAGTYAMFRVRETTETYMSSSNTDETYTVTQSELYEGNLEVTYKFFESDNCQLSDLASYYRTSLFGEDSDEDAEQPGLYIEFIGTMQRQNNILGISRTTAYAYSTLQDVITVGNELLEAGAENMVFKLTGFFNTGVDSTSVSKLKLNSKVGTKDDLAELISWADENGVGLYFDVDVQYVYDTTLTDGFSKGSDVAYYLSKTKARKYFYDPVTYQGGVSDLTNSPYILNATAVREAIQNVADFFSSNNISGISLRNVGSDVNADYKEDRLIERQEATNMLVEDLAGLSDFNLMTTGANAYALPYMDHALGVTMVSSKYDNCNDTVPFLQMVLQGNVSYTDESINLNGNTSTAVLDAIRSGAGFYYVLTTSEDADMRKTDHYDYFSTKYETWKADILEKIEILNNDSSCLKSGIVSYETLSSNVYKTTAEDGSYVITNYSTADYTYEGTVIAAGEYLTGKEGE